MRIFIVTFIRKAAVYSCAVCLEKDGGAGFEREPEREVCVHILCHTFITLLCTNIACVCQSCALASQLSTNKRMRNQAQPSH